MNPFIEFASEKRCQFLSDLQRLVEIDSGTHNKSGVNEVADWMSARLESIGFVVRRQSFDEVGDCLYASLRGAGRARLLVVGHMDTVYENGTAAARPIQTVGNMLIGPGVSDMKAGLLAGIVAVETLQNLGFDDFEEIGFVCTSDEEDGSLISADFIRNVASKFHAAFVLEAGRLNGDIVSARKGGGLFTLQVHGKSAHAGTEPELGVNAIVELAHQIIGVTQLNDSTEGVTVNVDVARGGKFSNTIPEYAEALVDVRATDQMSLDRIASAIQYQSHNTTVSGSKVDVRIRTRPVMARTPANVLLADLAREAAIQVGTTIGEAPMSGGTSDANFIAEIGIPVLDGLGPIGGNDHTPDEFLKLDSIVPRIAMLASLLRIASGKYEQFTNAEH